MVVTVVSLRVGQVTFCASARTSCRNLNGSIFAIARLNMYSPPAFQEETTTAVLFGECSPRKSVTGPLAMGKLPTASRLNRQARKHLWVWRPPAPFGAQGCGD